MTQKAEIAIGEGKNAYTVTLLGTSRDTFVQAALDPEISNKAGEDVVSALIARGGITLARRRSKNGALNNGPNGEPAEQEWYENGVCSRIGLLENGIRTNGPNGEPAVQVWNNDGTRRLAIFFKHGVPVKQLETADELQILDKEIATAPAVFRRMGMRLTR